MKPVFSIISGILVIAGFLPYIIAILRGETKPKKATWLIWATLDSITMSSEIAQHSINGQIIGSTIGAWVVFFLAIRRGESMWSKLDKSCLFGAGTGIILWCLFRQPNLALGTSLLVIFIGAIPTFISVWDHPEHENAWGWRIFWLGCIFALLGIPRWTFVEAAQPIVFAVIETTTLAMITFRKRNFTA